MLTSLLAVAALSAAAPPPPPPFDITAETPQARDVRMAWWREARFGMFIHWGLYAIPAGEWNGKEHPGAGEWLMNHARIRPADYEPLRDRFDPVDFDAKRWVEIAKSAGMRYIVITSKHHDGFCLWDSKLTDWDIAGTPFRRDILKELAAACRDAGIRLCFYHSIMDWTHPDYLPRRPWDDRPADGASFDRYKEYLKGQLAELLSGEYGDVGILWFDGEWENTWSHEDGVEIDDFVRSLKPDLIVNNRVDVGREGMQGMTRGGKYRGDYGTPEQEIPATGLPGIDWETCMTMNGSWGFHRTDRNWKSDETLIRMLVDIASKGGNFLLNVGPDERGRIPEASVERLAAMGRWLDVNGEAIYGTGPGVFPSLPWGRCTMRPVEGGTRLYLTVFDWPKDGVLALPGLLNAPVRAGLMADPGASPAARRTDLGVEIALPASAPDAIASVVTLDVVGSPRVVTAPSLEAFSSSFVGSIDIRTSAPEDVTVRYTRDGSEPSAGSPAFGEAITLTGTTTLKARCFLGDRPVGAVATRTFTRVPPRPAEAVAATRPGLAFRRWPGRFASAAAPFPGPPELSGQTPRVGIVGPAKTDLFGLELTGWIEVPGDGVYRFSLGSDDGSVLEIGGTRVVDNDGLHSMRFVSGEIALGKGRHPIVVRHFEQDGGEDLELRWSGPGVNEGPVPDAAFSH
jgi:alpha-L-fucosidase